MNQRMYSLLIVIMAIVVLFSPFFITSSHAQVFPGDTGPPGIVSCGDRGEPACQFCDLVEIAQDAYNFAVYFSVFVATLMFIYAGFLYVTAGGDTGQIGKATGVFGKVLVGIVIILTAWLIVDTIMKSFFVGSELDGGFGPWNQIQCGSRSVVRDDNQSSSPPKTGVVPSPPSSTFPPGYTEDTRTAEQKAADEVAIREELAATCEGDPFCRITFNKSNCLPNEASNQHPGGCTDVSRLHQDVKEIVQIAALECGSFESQRGSQDAVCNVRVSGGTELGPHGIKSGCFTNAPTHCSGNKVDISKQTAPVIRYVENNNVFENGTCSGGRPGRVHKANGSCWVDEGSHYDVERSGVN